MPEKPSNSTDYWNNVMVEDFANPKFNSYLDTQPGSQVEEGISKVHIQNIPEAYSNDAITQMCKEFGKVISTFKPPNVKRYAFVEFSNPGEAQRCIEEINCKFKGMKANFARSKRADYVMQCPLPPEQRTVLQAPNQLILNERLYKGPIVRPSHTGFLPREVPLSAAEYESCRTIDPKLMYYNTSALVDLLHPELDTDMIEKEHYKWHGGFWTQTNNERLSKLAESHTVEDGVLRQGKRQITVHSCQNCGRRTLLGCDKGRFCSKKCVDQRPRKTFSTLEFRDIKNNANVAITAVLHQNCIYVRATDRRSNEKYQKGLQKVFEACRTSVPVKEVKVGDIVAVKADAAFYRALVLKISNHVRVALLDTGAVTLQPMGNLYEVPESVKYFPIYISKVILKSVPDFYLCKEAINMLHSLMFEQINWDLRIQWGADFFMAEVLSNDDPLNVLLTEMVTIVEPGWDSTPLKEEDLLNIDIRAKNTKVRVVDNSRLNAGEIAVILESHFDKLHDIHDKVNHYGKTINTSLPYTPTVGELCLFNCGDTWYRAACFETAGDQHPTLLAIDYGFVTIVNIKNIAPFPEKLLEPPCLTQICNIHDFGDFVKEDNLRNAQAVVSILKVFTAERISFQKDKTEYQIESREMLDAMLPFTFFYEEENKTEETKP